MYTHLSPVKLENLQYNEENILEQLSSDLGDKGGAKEPNKKSHIENKHLVCKY